MALIPARGGSKRIPGKNIYSFHGQPLIAYSIEAALKSKIFEKVIVSTDDEDIAKISKKSGADVPFVRPAELATDTAGIHEVMSHAIKWCHDNNISVENVCCISATAPFLSSKDLIDSLKLLISSKKSYVLSASEYTFPIQRAFRINKNKTVELFSPEHYHSRSQDLEKSYHDAAQFYWGTVNTWMMEKDIYTGETLPFILPSWRVQDIDTYDDLKRAEILYEIIQKDGY